MTALPAGCRRWRFALVSALAAIATAVLPSTSGATPTYHGDASAGWGYQEGDVLTANPGTWTSTTDITYVYAWFNENSVPLGTGPTHTVTGSDVGHQIYAAIRATDASAPPMTVNTPTVGPMRYRPPVSVERPTVTGALLEGSTLLATAGEWVSGGASLAPIQITYAWYRGCTTGPTPDCSNSGLVGNASSLVLSGLDVGRTISLTVTASYPDGAGGQASNSVWLGNLGPVAVGPVTVPNTPPPPVPVVVKPLIGEPATTPRRPIAGKRFLVTFAVVRSDNRRPLTRGRMTAQLSVQGERLAHTGKFADGRARLALKVPATARHKLLRVKLVIMLGNQSTARVASFRVR